MLHIDFSDIKAQLVKSGLRQPKTNLVWQICFKIYPTTSEVPGNRWQIAESRVVSCLFAPAFTESGQRKKKNNKGDTVCSVPSLLPNRYIWVDACTMGL